MLFPGQGYSIRAGIVVRNRYKKNAWVRANLGTRLQANLCLSGSSVKPFDACPRIGFDVSSAVDCHRGEAVVANLLQELPGPQEIRCAPF